MKLRIVLATATLAAAAAAPAQAADHQFSLSSAGSVFAWEGAPDISRGIPVYDEDSRTAIPCDSGPARPCEEVLFKVEEPGKFTATVEGLEGTGGTTDVDAYLYKSDESGTAGEKLASAAANGSDSVTAPKATPGFYLLVVDYYHSYNSGYTGKVKFTSAVPPAPAPVVVAPVAAPPAPASAPAKRSRTLKQKRKACAKKAKKIKKAKKRKAALKRCSKLKK